MVNLMRTKITLIALTALFALFLAGCSETPRRVSQSSSNPSSSPARIPSYYRDVASAGTLPQTLSPEKFIGPAKEAYKVAQEIPDTLAQLPCYCYCDMHMGHKSL